MKKIKFSTPYENQVEVTVDGDKYGILIFDKEQNAWVLWVETIDDGISYSDDLVETEETITDEIQSYSVDGYMDNWYNKYIN